MRRNFQEQAAKGLMTLDEPANQLEELDEARETARSELIILEESRQRLEELERWGSPHGTLRRRSTASSRKPHPRGAPPRLQDAQAEGSCVSAFSS
jgi:hypothetical protein